MGNTITTHTGTEYIEIRPGVWRPKKLIEEEAQKE